MELSGIGVELLNLRKTQRYAIANIKSQVLTHNNAPGPGIESRPAANNYTTAPLQGRSLNSYCNFTTAAQPW